MRTLLSVIIFATDELAQDIRVGNHADHFIVVVHYR